MTLYGEFDDRFRPKPSALALGSVSLFATACGTLLASALVSSLRVVITRFLRAEFPLVFYAPFGDDPFAGLYPLRPELVLRPIALAIGISIAITMTFVYFYPSNQTLASRLGLHVIAAAIVAFAGVAPLFDLSLLSAVRDKAGVPPAGALGILVAAGLAVAILVALVERRTILVLGNVFPITTPGQRLKLWLVRIPVPCLALGTLAALNGWIGGIGASAALFVVTFFENISHAPKQHFEEVREPLMREAAITWPFAAAILLGAAIWAFGLAAASTPRRAVVIEESNPSFVRLDSLSNANRKTFEPKIEMNWSKPNKKR